MLLAKLNFFASKFRQGGERQEKIFKNIRRRLASPFLYYGVVLVAIALVLIFGTQFLRTNKFISVRNIFDTGQFLFPETNKAIAAGGLDLNIIGGSCFQGCAPPFLMAGKVLGSLGIDLPGVKKEIEEYTVQDGDTIASIAAKFEISADTILWANNLSKGATVKPGKKLVILPASGVLHIVGSGETLGQIAVMYNISAKEISDFNELDEQGHIFAGDFLIIPGGKPLKKASSYATVPLPQSYFICPIPSPCRLTQGLHFFNAVDLSNGRCGDPIFAAAAGEVQVTGAGNVSGNYVKILHPSGAVTFYGHLSSIAVRAGQQVYQGQIVGYMGHTGYTIPAGPAGCHLHFDVRFAANPFSK